MENKRTVIRNLLYYPHVHSARFGDVVFFAMQPERHGVSLLLRNVYCACERVSRRPHHQKISKASGRSQRDCHQDG